ncbi:hypothetical protein GH714_030809 [Hevea brasiliensis]|uniref:Uncharacterized protein n=1 Tax=Hevea brasiliensis TaxID=3981 RepID=A0A6A6M6X2_HEVBR|nr:hypothetical protein GH714_030809 [Hevea brasiliensis]
MDPRQPSDQKHHLFSFPIIIKRELSFLSQILLNNEKSSKGACDYSYGRWVRDQSYYKIQSYDETCPFLDPGFRCRRCGRKDAEYLNWRWKPDGCEIPRFNASDLLERSRNGRIVFAGDSIGRNQWESFLCILSQGVPNKSTIYEEHGKPITKHKGFLSMRFSEYNLTVEYYRVPFLVVVGRPPLDSPTYIKMTVKVDQLHWFSRKWVGADILVFSGGHWWNEYKTLKMNGTWNTAGRCDVDIEPEADFMNLEPEPVNNQLISDIIKQMELEYRNSKVQYLNITYLTQFRFDGHPSVHREPGTPVPAPQDCSHWCLPGIPDVWNEILYAHLLSLGFRTK